MNEAEDRSNQQPRVDEHVMVHDLNDEGFWEVGCSCGWLDLVWVGSYEECVEVFDNHCDVAFMEATMQGAPDGF